MKSLVEFTDPNTHDGGQKGERREITNYVSEVKPVSFQQNWS